MKVIYETGRVARYPFEPCGHGLLGTPDEMVESVSYGDSTVVMPYVNHDEFRRLTYIHAFENRLLVLATDHCIPKQQYK